MGCGVLGSIPFTHTLQQRCSSAQVRLPLQEHSDDYYCLNAEMEKNREIGEEWIGCGETEELSGGVENQSMKSVSNNGHAAQ